MSKHNNRNIVSGISEITGFPLDILSGSPLFHLYSDNELVIEGATNLEYYDECNIRIALSKMTVCITGRNLFIKCLANGNLSVSGIIDGISLKHISN